MSKNICPHISLYIPPDLIPLFIRLGNQKSGVPIYGTLLQLIATDLFDRNLIGRNLLEKIERYPFLKGRPTSKKHLSNHYSFAIPKPFRKTILEAIDLHLQGSDLSRSAYIWSLVRQAPWADVLRSELKDAA